MRSKNLLSILATIVILVSVIAPVLLIGGAAKAQDTITLSSGNLNPYKVIKITVVGDLGDGPLRLVVKDAAGSVMGLTWWDGTTDNYFEAYRVGARTYVAYLGGSTDAKDAGRPANPPEFSKTARPSAFAYITNPAGLKGQKLTIEVVGTDISTTVLYETVTLTLTFTVKDISYRRVDAIVPFTIVDGDLNYDPTASDQVDATGISADLTLIKAEGGIVPVTGTLADIIGINTITETAVNSAKFSMSTTIETLNDLFNAAPGGRWLFKGDRVQLVLTATGAVQGGAGWDDTVAQVGSDTFNAVYRPPSISISANSKAVTIDITSPDDNTNPNAVDHLDDQDLAAPVGDDTVVRVTVGTASCDFDCTDIAETGRNTNVFELSLPVQWGNAYSVSSTAITLPVNTDGPFKITAEYKMRSEMQMRSEGYNIDARGEGYYTPMKASIELVKATTKTIALKVTDADLNNDAKVVEWLDAALPDPNVAKIELRKAGITVAKLELYDVYGNPVGVTNPVGLISFVETGFDTGVFDVKIDATKLIIKAGATYILKYWDLTGYTTITGLVQINVPVEVVGISLDRTELPVNRDGIEVIVTYSNDNYNKDPSKKDSAPITAEIVLVDGTTIPLGTTTLTETDIDSGIFSGKLIIAAGYFATPAIIDAKLKVWDEPFIPEDKAVIAVFKAHDSSIEVDLPSVKWGDVITITVNDPDANYRTTEVDEVSVDLYLGNRLVKGLTLKETDKNTGIFKGTLRISWDDPDLENIVFPASTLSVKYVDNTPIMSPTATSWSEVPYVATFKVISTDGALTVTTAEAGYLGVLEELKGGKVNVVDPDMNKKILRADELTNLLFVSFEGLPGVDRYTLVETEANTGKFVLPTGVVISLPSKLGIDVSADPWGAARILADYIGKKVSIFYRDEYNAAGVLSVVTKTLTIKAWTAEIITNVEAINMGEWLTISVKNPEIAGTDITEFKQITVKSTSYPVGIVFYLDEVKPGVFETKLQVVSMTEWITGAKQIPAKLGDTITIEYVDPVTADGKSKVLITKTVVVGVPVERPVPASAVKFADPITGAVKTAGKVGEMILLQAIVKNVDVVEKTCTVVIKVKDAAGATIYIGTATATLAPGQEFAPGITWVPTLAGDYTIEVLVIKSLAEPTPYSDKITAPLTVTA